MTEHLPSAAPGNAVVGEHPGDTVARQGALEGEIVGRGVDLSPSHTSSSLASSNANHNLNLAGARNTLSAPDTQDLYYDPRMAGMGVPPKPVGNPFAPVSEGGSGMSGKMGFAEMSRTRGTMGDSQVMNTEYVTPRHTAMGNGVYAPSLYGINNPKKEALPGHTERFWPAIPYVGATALLNLLPKRVRAKIFSDKRYTGDSERRREDADEINR